MKGGCFAFFCIFSSTFLRTMLTDLDITMFWARISSKNVWIKNRDHFELAYFWLKIILRVWWKMLDQITLHVILKFNICILKLSTAYSGHYEKEINFTIAYVLSLSNILWCNITFWSNKCHQFLQYSILQLQWVGLKDKVRMITSMIHSMQNNFKMFQMWEFQLCKCNYGRE